jgi:hypothetical protein
MLGAGHVAELGLDVEDGGGQGDDLLAQRCKKSTDLQQAMQPNVHS